MREKKQQYVKREKEVLMLLSDKIKTSDNAKQHVKNKKIQGSAKRAV